MSNATFRQIEHDSKSLADQIGEHCHLSESDVDSLFYAIHMLVRNAYIDGATEVLQSFKTDTVHFSHLDL